MGGVNPWPLPFPALVSLAPWGCQNHYSNPIHLLSWQIPLGERRSQTWALLHGFQPSSSPLSCYLSSVFKQRFCIFYLRAPDVPSMDVGLNDLVCDFWSRSPNVLISYIRCPETPDLDHFKLNCCPELFQATQVVGMWTANLIKATLWEYILKGCSPTPSWLTAISLLYNGGLFLVHSRCNLEISGDTLTNWTTGPGQSFCLLPKVFVSAPMSVSFG